MQYPKDLPAGRLPGHGGRELSQIRDLSLLLPARYSPFLLTSPLFSHLTPLNPFKEERNIQTPHP